MHPTTAHRLPPYITMYRDVYCTAHVHELDPKQHAEDQIVAKCRSPSTYAVTNTQPTVYHVARTILKLANARPFHGSFLFCSSSSSSSSCSSWHACSPVFRRENTRANHEISWERIKTKEASDQSVQTHGDPLFCRPLSPMTSVTYRNLGQPSAGPDPRRHYRPR